MVEPNEISVLVDNAIGQSKALYETWYEQQKQIWPDLYECIEHKCYNTHSTVIVYQGTGRECALLYEAIDEALYNRGVLPWCDYISTYNIKRIKPEFVSGDMYAISVTYSGKGVYTYNIDKVGYVI
jgi:hypothetical protein